MRREAGLTGAAGAADAAPATGAGTAGRNDGRPSHVRKHIVVTGMVQGVGFRYESVRAARRIGIVGWVRNCMDGSVELEIQGEPEPVAQMIEWLWHGPQWARVDDVTVESELPKDPIHAERTFLVVR